MIFQALWASLGGNDSYVKSVPHPSPQPPSGFLSDLLREMLITPFKTKLNLTTASPKLIAELKGHFSSTSSFCQERRAPGRTSHCAGEQQDSCFNLAFSTMGEIFPGLQVPAAGLWGEKKRCPVLRILAFLRSPSSFLAFSFHFCIA